MMGEEQLKQTLEEPGSEKIKEFLQAVEEAQAGYVPRMDESEFIAVALYHQAILAHNYGIDVDVQVPDPVEWVERPHIGMIPERVLVYLSKDGEEIMDGWEFLEHYMER